MMVRFIWGIAEEYVCHSVMGEQADKLCNFKSKFFGLEWRSRSDSTGVDQISAP
jgi:hypothetical protein